MYRKFQPATKSGNAVRRKMKIIITNKGYVANKNDLEKNLTNITINSYSGWFILGQERLITWTLRSNRIWKTRLPAIGTFVKSLPYLPCPKVFPEQCSIFGSMWFCSALR